jgi:hypothetical protein
VRNKAISAIFSLFFLAPVMAHAGSAAPEWLRSLAQQPQKKYADDVNAVVLRDDREVTVRDAGDIVTHRRIAFRILRPEGKEYAEFGLHFDKETKVNSFHGWSMTTKGEEYEAKEKDAVESSLTSYEIFSDVKYKIMMLPGADIGTVVGFEYEQKDRPFLFQDFWQFQREIPVERSSYSLYLPAGWEYRANWMNHGEQSPVEQNGVYAWEVRDVARIEREYNRPPERALAGTMIVTFFSEKIRNQTFRSWNDLGLWYSQLTADTRQPSPALQQAVQQLAPPGLPLLDRIRALARFAQREVRYAAIEVGIGGFKPHPAADVFAHRYGDCKDKATVLSAMLGEIGVKSFYMPIHDERRIYTDKTPPNLGFDHVILAIQLPDASYSKPLPAVYEHPKLGHLLIFDPTNELVPLGQLPHYEQDSFALLVTDSGGELIHLPVSPPEANLLKRTAKVKLLPDGSLQGEVEEVSSGYRAALAREYWKDATEKDRRKLLERILGATLGNFQVEDLIVSNADDLDKDLVIRYKFTAEHYAKNAGPLLLVRPRVLGEKLRALDTTKPRHYPYEFEVPTLQTDIFEFNLPDGYKIDELPEAAKAAFAFGEYNSKIENGGATLKYSREYRIKTTSLPAEGIPELNRFFHEINQDERNMAILKKAN